MREWLPSVPEHVQSDGRWYDDRVSAVTLDLELHPDAIVSVQRTWRPRPFTSGSDGWCFSTVEAVADIVINDNAEPIAHGPARVQFTSTTADGHVRMVAEDLTWVGGEELQAASNKLWDHSTLSMEAQLFRVNSDLTPSRAYLRTSGVGEVHSVDISGTRSVLLFPENMGWDPLAD